MWKWAISERFSVLPVRVFQCSYVLPVLTTEGENRWPLKDRYYYKTPTDKTAKLELKAVENLIFRAISDIRKSSKRPDIKKHKEND